MKYIKKFNEELFGFGNKSSKKEYFSDDEFALDFISKVKSNFNEVKIEFNRTSRIKFEFRGDVINLISWIDNGYLSKKSDLGKLNTLFEINDNKINCDPKICSDFFSYLKTAYKISYQKNMNR